MGRDVRPSVGSLWHLLAPNVAALVVEALSCSTCSPLLSRTAKQRTPGEIAGIREACRVGRLVLDTAHAAVRPGALRPGRAAGYACR